jgi:hypothetical protein
MGGGGMGRLERNEKFIVILEFLGPRSKDEAKAFNDALNEFKGKFKKSKLRYSYRAVKDKKDQKRRND